MKATGTKRSAQARGRIARGTPHRLIAGATGGVASGELRVSSSRGHRRDAGATRNGDAHKNGVAGAAPAPARAARGVALSEGGERAIAEFRQRVAGIFYGGREVLVIGAGVYDAPGSFTPAESPKGVFADVVILRPGVTIEAALDRLGEFIRTIAVDGPRDNCPDAIGFTSC